MLLKLCFCNEDLNDLLFWLINLSLLLRKDTTAYELNVHFSSPHFILNFLAD